MASLLLLAGLTVGCFPKEPGPRLSHFPTLAPAIGQQAPPLSAVDLAGQPATLEERIGRRPIVLQFGSHSCPVYRYRRFSMEDLWLEYADRVHFVVVYTQEAHPVGSKSPYAEGEWDTWWNRLTGVRLTQPDSVEERIRRADFSRSKLPYEPEVLVDRISNTTWHRYGAASAPAFVIDRCGRIVARQAWVSPEGLKPILDRLLGEQDDSQPDLGCPATATRPNFAD